jgi:hypothetical protein
VEELSEGHRQRADALRHRGSEKVLYSLETGVPMIIADEVTVIKPRSRRRTAAQEPEAGTLLDIRFNMSGYLRGPA